MSLVTGTGVDGTIETVDGRQVGYLERGPDGGRRVLYLHGMPGCRLEQCLVPDHILDRFAVRLVSVDRAGWGNTDALSTGRPERVADVIAVCDALGIGTFPLMAFSAGGTFALTLAAIAPDRVERVVLQSAQMPYDDDEAIADLQPGQLAMVPAARLGRIPPVEEGTEEFRRQLLADPFEALEPSMGGLTPVERRFADDPWVRDVFNREVRAGLERSVDGLLDDFVTTAVPFEVDVSSVRCPVRAVHGTIDDWEPLANLRRILSSIDDARIFTLEGFNHFGPLLHPEIAMALATGSG